MSNTKHEKLDEFLYDLLIGDKGVNDTKLEQRERNTL